MKFGIKMAVAKTPISLLQEICTKYVFAVPKYQLIENGPGSQFEILVTASNYSASGVDTVKQQAKHKAAQQLLGKLRELDELKDILKEIPALPQSEKNNNIVDPVSNLLEICAKHNWEMPSFNLKGFSGPSNDPVFTIECAFKEFRAEGCARTKKDAKKVSAKLMLEKIGHLVNPPEDDAPLEEQKVYTIDEILALFRKHHKWNRTPSGKLSDRHFYFEKFPADKKAAAKRILQTNDTQREIIDAFCKELNIKYQVSSVPRRPQYTAFELLVVDFDCIIINKEPEIWSNIVDYFKAMMWAC